jgi:hypothetical protein
VFDAGCRARRRTSRRRAALLARRRQIDDLPGRLQRFGFLLRLFGLALFVLAIELRHDLARGGLVEHADLDRLAAAAPANARARSTSRGANR